MSTWVRLIEHFQNTSSMHISYRNPTIRRQCDPEQILVIRSRKDYGLRILESHLLLISSGVALELGRGFKKG